MRAEAVTKVRRPAKAASEVGPAPTVIKAAVLVLEPDMATRTAMTRIFTTCMEHWTANEAAAMDGGDPEGVHQLRVGLRRFRSALTLFAPLLPSEQLASIKEDARWAVQELNAARDWDVFLGELVPPVSAARGEAMFAPLRDAAEARRARGYHGVGAMLRSERYGEFMARLRAWLTEQAASDEVESDEPKNDGPGDDGPGDDGPADDAHRSLDAPVTVYAQTTLAKRHKKALKRGKGFDTLTSEQRHRVRIALKKLRYATEFFQSLFPGKRTQTYLARLKRLQDDLGHLNDVAVADRLLRELIAASSDGHKVDLALAAGQVQGWYARGVTILEPDTRRDWSSFRKSKRFWTKRADPSMVES